MFKKHTYDNGLRLVTKNLPNTQAITVLILVGAGSRYETKEINGISHFLEHMFFKGAEKYKNTKEVSEAIDGVGGEFNAFTGKEYAGYYVKLAKEHFETAMDVLSDMLIHARFDPKEIDKERGVILEEYNMYQDTPMYQIGWNFERLLFGDQPLGWDQIGTKELIKSVTQKQFKNYQKTLYTPDNTVIAIVGNIDHEQAVEKTSEYFEMPKTDKGKEFKEFQDHEPEQRIHLTTKKTEQAHIVLGFPGLPYGHKDKWILKILSIILGGNMSSRMFLRVREQRGLSYYIRTGTDNYSDIGTISTSAGVDVNRIEEAIQAIIAEYKTIKGEKIPQEEITKAKEYLKGKLVLKLEDSEEYAHLLGRQELLLNETQSMDEIKQSIDAVSQEDLAGLSEKIFDENKLYAAIIGPYNTQEQFTKLLNFN